MNGPITYVCFSHISDVVDDSTGDTTPYNSLTSNGGETNNTIVSDTYSNTSQKSEEAVSEVQYL